jgi:hypothetical protein
MNKNLVICPSRGRPFEFGQFLESFRLNSVCSDLLVILDVDDKELFKYDRNAIKSELWVNTTYKTTTDIINASFGMHRRYAFYSVTNDDFVYQTPGWDNILCQKRKISYGNDLLAGADMPTTSVIDGDIVRALGWLQLPTTRFLNGDSAWKAVGHDLNALKYHKDVLIEHRHWSSGHRQPDETSMRTNNAEVVLDDGKAFKTWLHEQKNSDINRIKEALQW